MKYLRHWLKQFEVSLPRWPTTHAHFEVSINDDRYWITQNTATRLTDHNSALSAPNLLSESSFQSS